MAPPQNMQSTTPSPDHSTYEAGISSSDYAKKARRLLEASRTLRDLGGQEIFDIPRIVVIGGQSAGKSSLVEAVTGIRVPRDSGTCTRCPMEVNLMTRPGAWSGRISLRIEYDAEGQRAEETRTHTFGPELTNPDEVELYLRRAQAAVLNYYNEPNSVEVYAKKSKAELQGTNHPKMFGVASTPKFSKNTVVVDISEPDGADLSFVDLPGLVQNQDPEVVQMVEDLVKTSIEGNALILVAIPMSDDMENQRSMRLALDADKDRSRTIGVLTKPDTLTRGATGARQRWRDLLAGRDNDPSRQLKLGYYCVKLPDDESRLKNLSREQRRKDEMDFFDSAEWRELLTGNAFRCGVQILVKNISAYLTDMLNRLLPDVRRKADSRVSDLKMKLRRLGEPPDTRATTTVLNLVRSLNSDLEGMVKGSDIDVYDSNVIPGPWWIKKRTFIQGNRKRYGQFKQEIRNTAPRFVPLLSMDSKEALDGISDSEEEKKDSEEDGEDITAEGKTYDLNDVRDLIEKLLCWEFPNEVPRRVKRELIKEFTQMWRTPTEQCFGFVADSLKSALDDLITRHCAEYPRLLEHLDKLVGQRFEEYRERALDKIFELLQLEDFPMYTQNSEEFYAESEKWLARYRVIRRLSQKDVQVDNDSPFPWVQIVNAATIVAKHGLLLCKTDKSQDLFPKMDLLREIGVRIAQMVEPTAGNGGQFMSTGEDVDLNDTLTRPDHRDEFERELSVMADVRAYFQVAYKRIIDYVPLKIEQALNKYVAETLFSDLMQDLGFNDGTAMESLEELLAEDPKITQHRDDLKSSIDRYDSYLRELRFFSVKGDPHRN